MSLISAIQKSLYYSEIISVSYTYLEKPSPTRIRMSKVLGEQIIAQYWPPPFVQPEAFLEEGVKER